MNKYSTLLGFTIFLTAVFIAGIIFYNQNNTLPVPSTYVLTPSPVPSPTKAPEPVVMSWTTYKNDKFNFMIDMPEGWNQQEYIPISGGFLVAFSPDNNLPCATCTYVHDGYYSVKIYNQKTDPEAYTDFTTRMKSIGQSKEYIPVTLDGVNGVLFGSSVAVENHGWVYEVNLDTDNGNDNAADSKIFQRAASSLKFTYLIFTN